MNGLWGAVGLGKGGWGGGGGGVQQIHSCLMRVPGRVHFKDRSTCFNRLCLVVKEFNVLIKDPFVQS